MNWSGLIEILRRNSSASTEGSTSPRTQPSRFTPQQEFEHLNPEQMYLATRYHLPPVELDWQTGILEAFSEHGLDDRFYYEWRYPEKQVYRYTRKT